jgi:integrase
VPEPTRRQRRKVLTDKMVAALPRKRRRYIKTDPEQRGMYVRVPPEGPCVFAAVARSPHGKQVWAKIGTADVLKIEDAREKAREAIGRIKKGLEPFEPPAVEPDTVADVIANWLRRHVEANKLRRGGEMRRLLEKHVIPVWGRRPFAEIRRSDIARLLDAVEDAHGPWIADAVLSTLRAVASWYATRHDTYVPPFTKNMRRVPAQDRKRSRILFDDELRRVWLAAEAENSVFAKFVMLLLLTAQRREKVATMRWSDLSDDGVWTIRTESAREKGHAGSLKLPKLAMQIVRSLPRFASNEFVFAGRRLGEPIAGFAPLHTAFKARCGVEDWVLHDLRRNARSLLSRTDVRPDIAERCLGHTVGGAIAQTYDRHDYRDEMGNALAKLAALIETIVRGEPGGNVLPWPAPAAAVQQP